MERQRRGSGEDCCNGRALAFWKMHGLGNDFMVIDGIEQEETVHDVLGIIHPDLHDQKQGTHQAQQSRIQRLAHRHEGVGFDQLLVIQRPATAQRDISHYLYRIFNADGTEVSQCGNGARCIAPFIAHVISQHAPADHPANGSSIIVHTMANQTIELSLDRKQQQEEGKEDEENKQQGEKMQ